MRSARFVTCSTPLHQLYSNPGAGARDLSNRAIVHWRDVVDSSVTTVQREHRDSRAAGRQRQPHPVNLKTLEQQALAVDDSSGAGQQPGGPMEKNTVPRERDYYIVATLYRLAPLCIDLHDVALPCRTILETRTLR